MQPARTSMRPACHPNTSKVGPLDILIMSSTTFIKLGLWVWCSSMLKLASVALQLEGGCGASGWASGAAGGRTCCGSHRVDAEERLRWPSSAGLKSPIPLPLSAPRCKEVFRKTQNVTVEAVAQDNLNDVLTNAVAIASALAAASVAPLWVVDPIGAILLSLFIIGSWVHAASLAHGVHLGGGVSVAVCAWCVDGACVVCR